MNETEQQPSSTDQAEVGYLVWAQPDDNQAESLASYLTRHGLESFAAGNEVTVPISDDLATIESALQLRAHWKLFWRYSEAELYGLPCYHKPACDAD